jgi:triosephosphate isomerase
MNESEPIILGVNLKMYLGREETLRWCREVARIAQQNPGIESGNVQIFVLPAAPLIADAITALHPSRAAVGGQNLCWQDRGALTGEVSAGLLAELGCRFAAIGHVERRRLFGEDDEIVARKTAAALRHGLTPVVCIGEPKRGDVEGAARWCIRQLSSALSQALVPGRIVVAYEPAWAIGAAEPAPPEHIVEVCRALRNWLNNRWGRCESQLIYGGSAGPGLLLSLGAAVDGLFLGRFAHDPGAFERVVIEAEAAFAAAKQDGA